MPRRSTEALAGEAWRSLHAPPSPPPPEHLPDGAKRYWISIAASKPHDYFDPATKPLLECLCSSYWVADTLWHEINKAADLADPKGLARYRRLLIMATRQTALQLSLATKLRLLPRAAPGSMPQMARPPWQGIA